MKSSKIKVSAASKEVMCIEQRLGAPVPPLGGGPEASERLMAGNYRKTVLPNQETTEDLSVLGPARPILK